MCFNEQVSWVTFAVGSVVNLFVLQKLIEKQASNDLIVVVAYWQFTLFMQLAEAFVYRTRAAKASVEMAFWINVLQPVFLIASLTLFVADQHKILNTLVIATYISYFVLNYNRFSKHVFEKGCKHISLSWWKDGLAALLYFCASFYGMSRIPSFKLKVITFSIFILTFAVTQLMYPCSNGSMWCWSVAGAGLLTVVLVSVAVPETIKQEGQG